MQYFMHVIFQKQTYYKRMVLIFGELDTLVLAFIGHRCQLRTEKHGSVDNAKT